MTDERERLLEDINAHLCRVPDPPFVEGLPEWILRQIEANCERVREAAETACDDQARIAERGSRDEQVAVACSARVHAMPITIRIEEE